MALRDQRRRVHRHQWSNPIEDHLFGSYRRCTGLRCSATDPESKPAPHVQFGDWQIGTAKDVPQGKVDLTNWQPPSIYATHYHDGKFRTVE